MPAIVAQPEAQVSGCSLYRFFDRHDTLLYVGITSVGPERWVGHESQKAWWAEVTRTTVEHFPDRESASTAEKAAIRLEQPLHNTVHKLPRGPRPARVKRSPGSGTVIHRPDGRWAFVARVDGKQRWVNVHTEAEAELLRFCHEHRNLPRSVRDRAAAILTEVE